MVGGMFDRHCSYSNKKRQSKSNSGSFFIRRALICCRVGGASEIGIIIIQTSWKMSINDILL